MLKKQRKSNRISINSAHNIFHLVSAFRMKHKSHYVDVLVITSSVVHNLKMK